MVGLLDSHTKGKLLVKSPFPSCSLDGFVDNPDLLGDKKKDFIEFISSMLKLAPEQRLSALELLKSSWLGESGI